MRAQESRRLRARAFASRAAQREDAGGLALLGEQAVREAPLVLGEAGQGRRGVARVELGDRPPRSERALRSARAPPT